MTEARETLSVLMIDDDEEDIYTMRRAFQEADATVTFRSMADNTLIFDDAYDPRDYDADIVILDLNMPIFSGYETLRRIRSGPRPSLVPIIVLSTSSAPTDARRCYAGGANAVFTKASSFEYSKHIAKAITDFWQTPGIRVMNNAMGAS